MAFDDIGVVAPLAVRFQRRFPHYSNEENLIRSAGQPGVFGVGTVFSRGPSAGFRVPRDLCVRDRTGAEVVLCLPYSIHHGVIPELL